MKNSTLRIATIQDDLAELGGLDNVSLFEHSLEDERPGSITTWETAQTVISSRLLQERII